VPAPLERVVRRSLEKNPEERFQAARDLAFAPQAVSDPAPPQVAVSAGAAAAGAAALPFALLALAGVSLLARTRGVRPGARAS